MGALVRRDSIHLCWRFAESIGTRPRATHFLTAAAIDPGAALYLANLNSSGLPLRGDFGNASCDAVDLSSGLNPLTAKCAGSHLAELRQLTRSD